MSPPNPTPPAHDPASIISSAAVARTLTISDQHANILLTSSTPTDACPAEKDNDVASNENNPTRSLLKLILVPFHKTPLACIPQGDGVDAAKVPSESKNDEEKETKQDAESLEKEHSARVLKFLSRFDWRMTSESGAEYSFHEAFLRTTTGNIATSRNNEDESEPEAKRSKMDLEESKEKDKGDGGDACFPENSGRWSSFKAELISPASDRQVARAMPSPGLSMITETPDLYTSVTKPFVDGIASSGSLSWIKNIVEGKKERERLLHDTDGWILNVDTKWRTHPDALTVPQSEWFRHESVVDLYCLGIVKAENLTSLRDLTDEHLPTLHDMLENGPKVIETVYGVPSDQLRVFVHYPPQFYHFHVHFTRLHNDTGAQAEKAHLLADVIQNLEADPAYYTKRTMTYKLSLKDKLYKLIKASNSSPTTTEEKDAETKEEVAVAEKN